MNESLGPLSFLFVSSNLFLPPTFTLSSLLCHWAMLVYDEQTIYQNINWPIEFISNSYNLFLASLPSFALSIFSSNIPFLFHLNSVAAFKLFIH